MGKQLISVSEILTRSYRICKDNMQVFIQPIIIALIPTILLHIVAIYSASGFAMILMSLVATFIALWVSIVFIYIIDSLLNKKPVILPSLYTQSTSVFISFIWVSVLVAIASILGFIALIIPGIILSIYYSFAQYIVVLEKKDNKGIAALKASYHLVAGRWWATFVRLLIPAIVAGLIGFFFSVGIYAIIRLGHVSINDIFFGADESLGIITDTVFIFLTPLFTAFSVILYRNLQSVKQ